MRLLLLLLLCSVAAAEEHAFLEMETPREAYFLRQPIRLRLRIGLDRDFFRTNAVPLFRRPMDFPVQVSAPWLESLDGTTSIVADRRPDGPTVALNDDVVACARAPDVTREGRTFTVLEIERTYRPTRSGELVIPAPRLRFAYGTTFEEDFVNGRKPRDRREAFVDGKALVLDIRPLPEEGRPPEFTGAVGRFTVRAETTLRTLDAGQSFRLTLHIEGVGNLWGFDVPRLGGLTGFHVYGAIDDHGTTRRSITYDVAPLDGSVTAVPSIPFAFFDPEPPAGYRVVTTEPIPLDVKGTAEAGPAPPTAADTEETPGTSAAPLLALALAVAFSLLLWMHRKKRERPDPEQALADAAVDAFRTRLSRADTDVSEALAGFLAAHLRCTTAAVIAPGLAARLTAAGVTEDLAARTAALLESLVGTRYGGDASVESGESAAQVVVDELDVAFRPDGLDVTTLIDGHNALHRLRMRTDNHENDRRELVRRVYAIDAGAIVFFDARCAPPDLPSSSREEGVRVRYCRNEEADAAILRRVRESENAAQFTVVTDDREVAGSARQLGARSRAVHDYFTRPPGAAEPSERADPEGDGGFTPEDFGLPRHVDMDDPPRGRR